MIGRSVIVLMALVFGVAAQGAEPIAIRAARMLDVKSGALSSDAVVIVEGERITAAGSGIAVPRGARVIDLKDVTLLPGLIDCHTHLMSSGAEDYAAMLLTKSQADRALEGAANARRTLMAGFTAVRDVENEGSRYADVALRRAIQRGLVEGPRMKVATRGIAAVGQYAPFGVSPDLPDFPRGAQMVSGVEEARRAVREQLGNGADLIKVYADWMHPTLTPDELRVIVEETHKAGKHVAAHATTPEGIRNAVHAGVDSIEHGDEADRETLERMKQRGVWLVPTLATYREHAAKAEDAGEREFFESRVAAKEKTLRVAREIGVRVAAGYDPAEEDAHGKNAHEIAALTSAGFTSLEAIRAATLSGAELLGWQDRIGSLEAGKLADVIAVEGNPLADIRRLERVVFVMKGGVVVKDRE